MSDITLNLTDLNPRTRLDALFERGRTTHVDKAISVKRYLQIAEALLLGADHYKQKRKNEVALLHYVRYQSLVKSIRKHPKFSTLPMGQRSAFDYKLKKVSTHIKELTEEVRAEYEKFYRVSKLGLTEQDIEVYQEQRPTISTVRTFVSAYHDELPIQPDGDRHQSAIAISLGRAATSNIEMLSGLRKSIFPTRQVREFDKIYAQRKIVRSHRTVILPSRITTEFSHLSLTNTKKNLETVAYLAGKEVDANQLAVTHLILPEQIGYSDYFKIRDSPFLIRYLERNDLLILGWIHSHPIESCYLSSSDVHYHSVFQSVLPEAVAIVYSPKYMTSTVFNLTPNHGLSLILNCRKKGFHVHSTYPPITMVSQHAVTDLYGQLEVMDYRQYQVHDDSIDAILPSSTDLFERMMSNRGQLSNIRKSEVTFVHIK